MLVKCRYGCVDDLPFDNGQIVYGVAFEVAVNYSRVNKSIRAEKGIIDKKKGKFYRLKKNGSPVRVGVDVYNMWFSDNKAEAQRKYNSILTDTMTEIRNTTNRLFEKFNIDTIECDFDEFLTVSEITDYLKSTGLFSELDLNRAKKILESEKTIPICEVAERMVAVDKWYDGLPWNILQILVNINMIVPVEDRKDIDG